METLYIAYNGAAPTTAALTPVTTGTAIKTMLQVLSTKELRIVEWGVHMDGAPSAIKWELLSTGTVAATVTAHVSAGVMLYNNPNGVAATVTLSTSGTGYTATAEGTITTTRVFESTILSTNSFVKQFPLGREPWVKASDVLRIRATAATAVNATCYVVWKEG
jgi:hypothetical protein